MIDRFSGQDFLLGVSATSSAAPSFVRSSNTSLEPRVPRIVQRLNLPDPSLGGARGLLQYLAISGAELTICTGPGTTTNALANSARKGFPLRALDPAAMVDQDDVIGCAVGPNSPFEMNLAWSTAQITRGTVGCDLVPAELLEEVQAYLRDGKLWGPENFVLGGGELTQGTANTAQTVSWAFKASRRCRLGRMVVDVFRDNGGSVAIGDFTLSAFKIANVNMLPTSTGIDCLGLSPFATDEDGLNVQQDVETDDLIEVSIDVAALGAGVSGVMQVGWFIS